jgi:hypothetical protein
MSFSLASHSAHPTSFPALAPDISADVTDGLIAAVTPTADGSPDDQFGHATTLIAELDALHPRDLEETLLASQLLAAYHGAMHCCRAAERCEVASMEDSRLRRDAIALQRSALATLHALHKSQARPVLEDAVDLVPRPTVPTVIPKPARTPPPAEAAAHHPASRADAEPDTAVPAGARPNAAQPPTANGGPPATSAPERKDPFAGHPDLRRLNDRWYDLPRWEEMTMEERRETFGYNHTPKQPEPPAAT